MKHIFDNKTRPVRRPLGFVQQDYVVVVEEPIGAQGGNTCFAQHEPDWIGGEATKHQPPYA